MLRIFKVEGLEERRRALVAESEVYRQTLHLHARNFRLYATRTNNRFQGLTKLSPLIALALPLAKLLLERKKTRSRSPLLRLATAGFAGWKIYRKFSPVLKGLFSSHHHHPNGAHPSSVSAAR
jgi:hypothetical protein